jgi:hypothetical protein
MTQEELKKLGLADDVIQKILEDQGTNFVSKNKFNEVNEAKRGLETQITERDTQLKDLKKTAGASEDLKVQIEKLQKDNTDQKTAYDTQIQNMKIDGIVNSALLSSKAKNAQAVKALLKMEKYELDGDKVKGLDDAIAAAKKDNAWAFEDETKPTGTEAILGGLKPTESGDKGADGGALTAQQQVDAAFGLQ